MNKVFPDAGAALHDVFDGAVILAGGSTFIQRNIIAERILGMPKS